MSASQIESDLISEIVSAIRQDCPGISEADALADAEEMVSDPAYPARMHTREIGYAVR